MEVVFTHDILSVNMEKFHMRGANPNSGTVTPNSAQIDSDDSRTVNVQFNKTQQRKISHLEAPLLLDIYAGAVIAAPNQISDAMNVSNASRTLPNTAAEAAGQGDGAMPYHVMQESLNNPVILESVSGAATPIPSVTDANYYIKNKTIGIMLNQTISHTKTDPSKIQVRSGNTSIATLSGTLTGNSMLASYVMTLQDHYKIAVLSSPALHVEAGAFQNTNDVSNVEQENIPITIHYTAESSVVSAEYMNNGTLFVTFSSEMDAMNIASSGFNITRTIGQTATTAYDSAINGNGTRLRFTIQNFSQDIVDPVANPRLVVGLGAAWDVGGNPAATWQGGKPKTHSPVTVAEAGPKLSSASYYTGNSSLVAAFDRNVDTSAINSTEFVITGLCISAHPELGSLCPGTVAMPLSGQSTTADGPDRAHFVIQNDTIKDVLEILYSSQLSALPGAINGSSYGLPNPLTALALAITDTLPPQMDSATYYTNGTLIVTFSEGIVPPTDATGFCVFDDSRPPCSTLNGPVLHPSPDTLRFSLASPVSTLLGNMTEPWLAVSGAALADSAGNDILSDEILVDVVDITPPRLDYSTYATGNRTLLLALNEIINHTLTRHDLFEVTNTTGGSDSIPILRKYLEHNATDTIRYVLNATSGDKIAGFSMPTLKAASAAVSDLAMNPIEPTSLRITVIDTTPPALLRAAYDNGTLSLSFTEELDHAATVHRSILLQIPSLNFEASLDAATIIAAGQEITYVLSPEYRALADAVDKIRLRIGDDTVYDVPGNPMLARDVYIATGSGPARQTHASSSTHAHGDLTKMTSATYYESTNRLVIPFDAKLSKTRTSADLITMLHGNDTVQANPEVYVHSADPKIVSYLVHDDNTAENISNVTVWVSPGAVYTETGYTNSYGRKSVGFVPGMPILPEPVPKMLYERGDAALRSDSFYSHIPHENGTLALRCNDEISIYHIATFSDVKARMWTGTAYEDAPEWISGGGLAGARPR